ncbi:MAG TPA: FAD-dependent oxidoreductase [Conexibacter sp.]|nr:FAD-dependent oxidoreductase [Conexibacter sp.]
MLKWPTSSSRRVVIAGGGVAAVETLLALRALPRGATFDVTVIAPGDELVYKPLAVTEPFGHAHERRYRLDAICHDLDATLVRGWLRGVDGRRRVAQTSDGRALPYDALVVATGASSHEALPGAVTFFGGGESDDFSWIVRELETGITRSIAFVVPTGGCWPLPLYELALMTAERAAEVAAVDLSLTLVTPEEEPLAAFHGAGSAAVGQLLAAARVAFAGATRAHDYDGRTLALSSLETEDDRRIAIDRVVALPALRGPAIEGLPLDRSGFVRVDNHCAVRGLDDVYAIGDATTFPLKQGGVATQQADAVAAAIGGRSAELRPHLRAMLLTGGEPLYLSATVVGGVGVSSSVSHSCPWWPPHKIAARHLAPYLADRQAAAVA